MSEKLEIADKEGNDFELQVSALKRRIALVEEEKRRINEKQSESEAKLEEYQDVSFFICFKLLYNDLDLRCIQRLVRDAINSSLIPKIIWNFYTLG